MGHLIILTYILSFSIGVTAIIFSFKVFRTYRLLFLRAYIFYIIFLNLIVLINLAANYFYTNVTSNVSENVFNIFYICISLAGYVVTMIMILVYAVFIWNLLNRNLPNILKYIYFPLCILLFAGYMLGLYVFIKQDDLGLFSLGNLIMNASMMAIFIIIAVYLIVKAKHITPRAKQLVLSRFGYFCLFVDVAIVISVFIGFYSGTLLIALITLILNLTLLIFLNPFLERYLGIGSVSNNSSQNLDIVFTKYNISNREKEIIEMILKGKSNKEIEQELYISPHTVKNHVYNIFQKTGVQSRGQLVNVIFNHYR